MQNRDDLSLKNLAEKWLLDPGISRASETNQITPR